MGMDGKALGRIRRKRFHVLGTMCNEVEEAQIAQKAEMKGWCR